MEQLGMVLRFDGIHRFSKLSKNFQLYKHAFSESVLKWKMVILAYSVYFPTSGKDYEYLEENMQDNS